MTKVFIKNGAYNKLDKEVRRYLNFETGGAIIGYPMKNSILITNVTNAGPLSVHKRKSLKLDGRFCLTEYLKYRRKNKKLKYLGDWHSHPSNRLKPSKKDIFTFLKKRRSHYNVLSPIMLITSARCPVTMKGFIHHHNKIVSTIPLLLS